MICFKPACNVLSQTQPSAGQGDYSLWLVLTLTAVGRGLSSLGAELKSLCLDNRCSFYACHQLSCPPPSASASWRCPGGMLPFLNMKVGHKHAGVCLTAGLSAHRVLNSGHILNNNAFSSRGAGGSLNVIDSQLIIEIFQGQLLCFYCVKRNSSAKRENCHLLKHL